MTIPNWEDRTILIVEDDEISMEFLTELLAPSNVKIVVARDGKQAVNFCENNKAIDVVLMDVRLPKMNGKEAMEEIKKSRPDLPIIAQTAFAMSGDKEKYIQSGFDDYISKPIIMLDLIQKISKHFTN
ncbi:MAG TPA: response regulator [Bacteroidales bacterium]|jgi:two-component system cell cycle response regulator DivK|nr:response regulator [Bacteroidales bacterium]